MIKNIKKITSLAIAISLGGFASNANAGCPVITSKPPIKMLFTPSFKVSETAIGTSLTAMETAVDQSLKAQTSAISNAISVLTAQKAMSATQTGAAIAQNTQVQVAAEQADDTAEKVKDIMSDYGSKGAGYNPCSVAIKREDIVITHGNTKKMVPVMIQSEVTARPGKYSNRGKAMAERLALHDNLYCTESQARSGLCHAKAPRAGKSLMAATMFEDAPYDSDSYRDKSALINNMMGLPDNPLTPETATTAQGQSYADLKRRKDAIKSTALTSLKNIQAEWSGVTSPHDEAGNAVANSESKQLAQAGKTNPNNKEQSHSLEESGNLNGSGVSLAKQMKLDVDRYLGGGKEYQDWSKYLVGANERGILKEILQVKALRLYMQAQQYEQLSRMEAMLAANVSAETYRNGMQANVDKQRQRIVRGRLQNMVNSSQ